MHASSPDRPTITHLRELAHGIFRSASQIEAWANGRDPDRDDDTPLDWDWLSRNMNHEFAPLLILGSREDLRLSCLHTISDTFGSRWNWRISGKDRHFGANIDGPQTRGEFRALCRMLDATPAVQSTPPESSAWKYVEPLKDATADWSDPSACDPRSDLNRATEQIQAETGPCPAPLKFTVPPCRWSLVFVWSDSGDVLHDLTRAEKNFYERFGRQPDTLEISAADFRWLRSHVDVWRKLQYTVNPPVSVAAVTPELLAQLLDFGHVRVTPIGCEPCVVGTVS